ncbi:actin cytoskeleton-regulatory complex protein PAN1-like [Oryzias latipes]|uniref:actin cytoskeleton-regulatory complex protein PAN1-like n=1 Tax=Oryzias latipes TaxID=8090 RepID=UPI0009D91588|nr:actin cytoskeleton-regulatory complex protein PAN1-like [Oryzias latipes]
MTQEGSCLSELQLFSFSSGLHCLVFLFFSRLKMTIKTFEIHYNAINIQKTFTNGDTMTGKVVLETTKGLKIKSLVFVGKGRARVCWRENQGDKHHVYWANEKFYSVKHHVLAGTVFIGKGRHEFLFSFKIPERDMPSTFNSPVGKVIHKVKAELKQSLKLTKKAKAHFTFVSKSNMDGLQEPQSGCKDKGLSSGSGNVSLDVHTPKRGYMQGEALSFKVEINNCSSSSVKPKFELYEKRSYFAQGHKKQETNKILNGRIDDGSSQESGHLSKTITIPAQLAPSILNCSIIKLEYRLRIYLDIEFAKDPEVKLPIVVLPMFQPEVIPPANTANAIGNPQQPGSCFTWQLNSGFVQQPGSGFIQVPASGLPRQLSLSYPSQPGMGFAQQPGSGFAQQPGSGFAQQPGSGFAQQPGSGFAQQPGSGFAQQPGSGFAQQPGSGFAQQPGSGFAQQPGSGFAQQPGSGFAQQPGSGFAQQLGSGFAQQPGSGFAQQPGSGFAQQPGSGFAQQPGSGFPQQPGSGFPQQPGSGFAQQPGSGFAQQPGSGFARQLSSGFTSQPGSGFARQLSSSFTSKPGMDFAQQTGSNSPQQPGSGFPQQPGSDFAQQPGSGFPQQPGSVFPQQLSSDFPNQPGSGFALPPLDPPPDYEECEIDPPPSYREIEKQ